MASTDTLGSADAEVSLNISAAERETGLSKDVLRMWERRYGFPQPGRDENGERQYTAEDIAKLRAIKRLMDVGARPGKLMRHTLAELNGLADARAVTPKDARAPAVEREVIAALQAHDTSALQQLLANLLMKQGLQRFVLQTVTIVNRAVGDAWMRGDLQVFEEHAYTELIQIVLRTAINTFPRQTGVPRALLTTFPGEQHAIGLLMLEALLAPEGVQCISLGPQTPLDDIRRAVLAHKVHVLALSFSSAFPVRQATDGLAALRRQLPPQVVIWAGGELTRRIRRTMGGVALIPDLAATLNALAAWRLDRAPPVHGY
jgi:DNA-binding transcriptional MerR regulator/methylmalonyl-CoA mutase cobalamin-binding subunit